MTAYSAIANTEIDADSPITEALLTKYRDNPIAIAEGSSGAPSIEPEAMEAIVAADNYDLTFEELAGTWAVPTWVKAGEFLIGRHGVYRFKYSHVQSGAGLTYVRTYKNGAAHGPTRTSFGPSTVNYSEDITAAPGDTLELWMNGGTATAVQVNSGRLEGRGSSSIAQRL